ncbi:hydroxyacylglutathione hydrolase [Enhydrobacter aerosaccus]|uniref:Hydroxyacylglutathione hydrolase n=1 Tax=Enhydrobacter aerosaccus TaxID=225324 RepID=A0A1T4R3N9_9HYPH|nr:hydroxyacylglutathione hydrolase [Enhydrobacter aerosaccus]SKA10589.1 hydroxyacylglutathione hydrolase [Enhydrobacter aerosaccus]
MSSTLDIVRIPVLSDNYVWLMREPQSGAVGVVDPAEAGPVLAEANRRGWKITHILNTHHHGDHVGGNREIKAATGCTIVGYRGDAARIPGIDVEVEDGGRYRFGEAEAEIFFVPGHTSGHIAYAFREQKALFCGDTLFALGCGKMFEGTPQQFWGSLARLRALPDDMRVYCAHEYTQSNARFAVTVERDNKALLARSDAIDAARARGEATVPSLLGEEKQTNPFLRADLPSLQQAVGLAGADPVQVFAEVRHRKDVFR